MKQLKKIAPLLPLTSGICWGGAGLFIRCLTGYGVTNFTVTCLRMIFCAIIIGVVILIKDRSLFRINPKHLGLFIACGVVGMAILNVLYNVAILECSLAIGAVLLALSPIFVLLSATVFLHEKITAQKAVSVVLAVCGCAFVSGIFGSKGLTFTVLGIACGLLAAVFYASNSIFSKKIAVHEYHFLTINFYCSLFAGISLIPFSKWHGLGQILVLDHGFPLWILILHAVLTSVIPYCLYFLGMEYLEAGKVAILASAEPPSAMVFGIFVYHEIPSALAVCGLCMTICAMILLNAKLPAKRNNAK